MAGFNRKTFGKYQKHDSIYSVFHGTDSFVLEDELNESQWEKIEQIASALRLQFNSGFTNNFTINAENYTNFFAIENVNANPNSLLIDGYQLNVGANNPGSLPSGLTVADNRLIVKLDSVNGADRTDLIVLEAWFEVISGNESINKFGAVDSVILNNSIIDSRLSIETSRRIQFRWRVRSISNKNSMSGVTAYKYDGTDSGVVYTSLSNIYMADTGEQLVNGSLKSPGIVYGIPLFTVSRNGTDVVALENISDIFPKVTPVDGTIKDFITNASNIIQDVNHRFTTDDEKSTWNAKIDTNGTGLSKDGTSLSISDTGVTAGTYNSVTVNAQGQVTDGANPTTLSEYGITDGVNVSDVVTTATADKLLKLDSNAKLPADITGNADGNSGSATKLQTSRTIALSGDITGTATSFDGTSNISISTTHPTSGVTAGTYPKVTVDVKGHVTNGTTLSATDIPTLTLSKISDAGTAASKNTGTASGDVPILDASGKLDTSILPGLALTTTNVVADQTSMLALTAEPGDLAVRTDLNKTFVLKTADASILANWQELLTPTDAVQSVAGKTGIVTLSASDVGLGNVTNESKTTMFTDAALTGTPTAPTATDTDNSTQIATTAFVKSQNYLTGNQNISVTGDATGSGSTSIDLILADSGVTAGTYKSVTVDSKGRVTDGTNPTTLSGYGITDASPKPVTSESQPSTDLAEGLVWYQNSVDTAKMYLNGAFRDVGGIPPRMSDTEPTTNLKDGLIWFNTSNNTVKVYLDGKFRNVGGTALSSFKSTVTLAADAPSFAHNLSQFNKDLDAILIYKNGTFLQQDTDYTISADGLSIVKVQASDGQVNWLSDSVFDIVSMASIPTENSLYTIQYENTFTTVTNGTTNIPIGIPQYVSGTDVLEVYADGTRQILGINYSINANGTSIDLLGWSANATPNANQFQFVVKKQARTTLSSDAIDGGLLIDGTVTNSKLRLTNGGGHISLTNQQYLSVGLGAPNNLSPQGQGVSGQPNGGANSYPKLFISDDSNNGFMYEQYGSGDGAVLRLKHAMGTVGAPTAVIPDMVLGGVRVNGYTGSQWSTAVAGIDFLSSENFTNTANGSYVKINTVPNGTTSYLERMRIDNAGNVQIGTTSVGYNANASRNYLTIKGSAAEGIVELASGQGDVDGAGIGHIQFTDITNNTADKRVGVILTALDGTTANNKGSNMRFFTKADGTSGIIERMRIDKSGNVGINTTSAIGKLHIVDDQNSGFYLDQYNGADGSVLRLRRTLGTLAAPTQTIADTVLGSIRGFGYTGSAFGSPSAVINLMTNETTTASASGGYITLSTTPNGTTTAVERMRIDNGGSVAIGSSGVVLGASLLTLQKTGLTRAYLQSVTSGNPSLLLDASGVNNAEVYVDRADAGHLKFGTGGTPGRVVIRSDGGAVGINTVGSSTVPLTVSAQTALSSTSGSTNSVLNLFGSDGGNSDYLKIKQVRVGTGSDWFSSAWRIQRTVDVTDEVNYLSFGRGSTGIIGIGINTDSPYANLHIATPNTGSAGTPDLLRLSGYYNSLNSGATLSFTNQHAQGTTPNAGEYNLAAIVAFDNTNNWGGALQFQTATTGTAGGTALSARMTIDSYGNFLINNTAGAPGGVIGTSVGGYLYVEGGALKFRGGNGTVTVIAPA